MFVRFRCPKCRAGLKAPATRRGHVIDCPGCQQMLRIPGQKPAGVDLEETTDYVTFDEQAGTEAFVEQSSATAEPDPLPKRKVKRKHAVQPGLFALLGGTMAAPWRIGVLVSFALSLVLCGGMLGWVYLTGRFVEQTPVTALSAAQLAQEYRDNPRVASRRYEQGNVKLEVSGVVRQVAAEDVEGPHVVLTGAGDEKPPWIRGYIAPDDGDARVRLRALKVGDTVRFRGHCDGRTGGFLDLSEIELVPD